MNDLAQVSEQTGEAMPVGLAEWMASKQTGASAKAIVAHLVGLGEQTGCYPHDDVDFMRCERLLDKVPALRAELPRMAEVNAYWAALVPRWDDLRGADDNRAMIKEIIEPIEEADPGHFRIGKGISVRLGPNEFEAGAAESRAKMEDRARKGRPPMKDDPEFRKHNDATYRVTPDELRQFIERFERLAEEKAQIGDQQKEVMAIAKARGYDTKVIRRIIALRKRNADDIAEEEAVLSMYKDALGMG